MQKKLFKLDSYSFLLSLEKETLFIDIYKDNLFIKNLELMNINFYKAMNNKNELFLFLSTNDNLLYLYKIKNNKLYKKILHFDYSKIIDIFYEDKQFYLFDTNSRLISFSEKKILNNSYLDLGEGSSLFQIKKVHKDIVLMFYSYENNTYYKEYSLSKNIISKEIFFSGKDIKSIESIYLNNFIHYLYLDGSNKLYYKYKNESLFSAESLILEHDKSFSFNFFISNERIYFYILSDIELIILDLDFNQILKEDSFIDIIFKYSADSIKEICKRKTDNIFINLIPNMIKGKIINRLDEINNLYEERKRLKLKLSQIEKQILAITKGKP